MAVPIALEDYRGAKVFSPCLPLKVGIPRVCGIVATFGSRRLNKSDLPLLEIIHAETFCTRPKFTKIVDLAPKTILLPQAEIAHRVPCIETEIPEFEGSDQG